MFDRVGRMAFFEDLVDPFYLGVAGDPVLRPLYPADLSEPRSRLALFLAQYWGGPSTYIEERGHPRLRMRHAPFVITAIERQAWLSRMTEAVDASMAPREDKADLMAYFEMVASTLINAP